MSLFDRVKNYSPGIASNSLDFMEEVYLAMAEYDATYDQAFDIVAYRRAREAERAAERGPEIQTRSVA